VDVDVLIVGARVAGSVLATLLGEAGLRVLVVDRAAFPSTTLSTHFFRGSGCGAVLERLGLLEQVLALGPPQLVCQHEYDTLSGTTEVVPPEYPGELGFNLSVRREPLDALLVERARSVAKVTVSERTNLLDLVWGDGRFTGARLSGPRGLIDVGARVVVGADGYASKVTSLVGAADQERADPSRVTYYRYVRGMLGPRGEPDGPEFSLGDDEMLYAFPSDADMTCVAVSLPLSAYAAMRPHPDAGFRASVASHPRVARRFAEATEVGRLSGCGPRPSVVRQPWGPGWALVGDASIHQDPWTGLGMDNASMHATFLADALVAWLDGREGESEALSRYHERRDAHALDGFHETVEIGRNLNAMRG
jgi:flavin-dependent dehydrogenase